MPSEDAAIQQHFLGCSIRNFNLNIGWLNESTKLTVGLVEDDRLFERFEGYVGELVRFQYDNFIFDGILSNITELKSDSGNRVWEIDISDPRELLDGVQLIIGGYTGYTYNVPNLYNIFGYLESFGFGRSLSNKAGIPWKLIRDAFTVLNQTTPIYLGGYGYYVNLLDLPSVPDDVRISENHTSLLSFIQHICDLANHDFTVIMIGNSINIVPISKNIQQLNGSIYRMLQTLPQYVSTEAGFELQYETANKFLVGSQVEQMYYQYYYPQVSGGLDTESWVDPIARYWGVNNFGNVILSEKSLGDDVYGYIPRDGDNPPPDNTAPLDENFFTINESFYIDAKPISWPGNNFARYLTDIDELRCVLQSRDTWAAFLFAKFQRARKFGTQDNIHWWKFNKFCQNNDVKFNPLLDNLDLDKPDGGLDIRNFSPEDFADLEASSVFNSNFDDLTEKVYNYLHQYASEFLDKKFMVRVPFVFARIDPDSPASLNPQILTSLEPTETGYIEESYLDDAVRTGLLPNYNEFLLDENNKIYCYVRFGPYNYVRLDLSEIPEEDYIVDEPFVYIKCTVEKQLVFINKATAYSPRAVITLPGRVKLLDEKRIFDIIGNEYERLVGDAASRFGNNNFVNDKVEEAKARYNEWRSSVGADFVFLQKEAYGLIPNSAAIPLKDNTRVYGPWYTFGMQGKVEFQQDFDLNPWNYGGFQNMNIAGQAMVSDVYTSTMIGEKGSVEVPGSPIFSIAHQLFASGPIITGITTGVGENGVVTTYRMEKWGRNYGEIIRHRLEQYKKTHALRRESRKNFVKLFEPTKPIKEARFGSIKKQAEAQRKLRSKRSASSHPIIMANVYSKPNPSGHSDPSGVTYNYNLSTTPMYQAQNPLSNTNWERVAGLGLQALFAPYSTDSNASGTGLPLFKNNPSGDITSNDLNPFKEGHNIKVGVVGSGPSGHQPINLSGQNGIYRGVGFRNPMILTGWGYDLSGDPIPGTSGEFDEDYLTDISKWKTGPVDLRWDEGRGVWSASSSNLIEGKLHTDITAPSGLGSSTSFQILSKTISQWGTASGTIINVVNRDPSLEALASDDIFVIISKINNEYRPIWVGCAEE